MRIKFISFSFVKGGAAVAAEKFCMIAKSVLGFEVSKISQEGSGKVHFFKRLVSFALQKLQIDKNPIKHSLNLFSYKTVVDSFRKDSSSVFHLHWVNNDTLSIFDFNMIPPGSIVTLHDEWIYCGSEHCYNVFDKLDLFEKGYSFFSNSTFGFPWNYFIWRIKKYKLSKRSDLIYTVPSQWMLKRAKRSLILKNSDVRLLPNPIDTDIFKPCTLEFRERFRKEIGVNSDDFIFCFGAFGGKGNVLKGAALLEEALSILKLNLHTSIASRVKVVIFGGSKKNSDFYAGFQTFYVGHISEPTELSQIYSSADCVVVPSLVESFGQVAAESLASGTPVVCFECSGLTDIVLDNETGMCAEPYSVSSLAEKLRSILEMPSSDRVKLAARGRKHIVSNFSYLVVAEHYKKIIYDASLLRNS